jgi:GNAT superfamily N-acetyltransferase
MSLRDIVIQSGDPSEVNALLDKRLYEFNVGATGFSDGTSLYASVEDEAGNVIAAISGHTWGGCCDVSLLWVHEAHRGQGVGRALLQAAAAEARSRGCNQMMLSTHSFQAPLFYEKLGYQRVATIPDYPNGHAKLYYVKRLDGPPE